MIKQMLSEAGLAPFAVIGLVIFVAVFVGISLWALTRRKRQIDNWSSMPLEDGDPYHNHEQALNIVSNTDDHVKQSCGKCENCDCHNETQETVTTLTL